MHDLSKLEHILGLVFILLFQVPLVRDVLEGEHEVGLVADDVLLCIDRHVLS